MSCVFCGGKMQERNETFVYEQDERVSIVEHVPAQVCLQCGEKTFSPEAVDDLLELAHDKQAQWKTTTIPVLDYAGLNHAGVS